MRQSQPQADPTAITAEQVRRLLRQLARDRTVAESPMAGAAFVRRSLQRAGYAPTREACAYELGRLMSEMVEIELGRLRSLAGLPTISSAVDALRADFGQDNPLLEAWSAIHHLCLRPDLGIDLPELCRLLGGMHRRTLQRRLRRGTLLLAAHLREQEHAARVAERRERLWDALPETKARRLFGVEPQILMLAEALEAAEPRVLALGGPGGIGKTALARALAERCLIEGRVQDLSWIEVAGIGAPEALCRIERSWRASVPGRRLLVVDGVDHPDLAEAVIKVRAELPPSVSLLATGRVGWAAWPLVRVMELPPLEQREALALLRHEARARGLRDIAGAPAFELAPLVAAMAGHPLAIERAVAALRAAPIARVAEDFVCGRGPARQLAAELWSPVWQGLDSESRRVVRAVIAASRGGGRPTSLAVARRSGLPVEAAERALRAAVDAGLLSRIPSAQHCLFQARPWLRRYLASTPEIAESQPADLAQSAD